MLLKLFRRQFLTIRSAKVKNNETVPLVRRELAGNGKQG